MTTIIRPIICYCSGRQHHKEDHIECRCDGQIRFNNASAAFVTGKNRSDIVWPKRSPDIKPDPDGYPLCRFCGKIRFKNWLVQCPYCDKYFKGPKFWFNKKFHYECEDCG